MNTKKEPDQAEQGPLKLAVTGGVGSGKSVVCERLKALGLPVYSADELAREAVMPGTGAYMKIVARFGKGVLMPDSTLDRAALRKIITRDPEAKKALEEYIHPEVIHRMAEKFEAARQAGEPVVGVEVPLLFEAGLQDFFDYIVTVCVERQRRVERIMSRDQVTSGDAEALMRIQMSDEEKCKHSHFVIDNNGSLDDVHEAVDRLHADLISRSKKKREIG